MYHGSSKDFEVFDPKTIRYMGCNGDGFYFTPDRKYAETYGPIVGEYQLTIRTPLYPGIHTLGAVQWEKILSELGMDGLANYGVQDIGQAIAFIQSYAKILAGRENDYLAVFDVANTSTGSVREVFGIIKSLFGWTFDAVVSPRFGEAVVFDPSQISKINQ